MLARLATRYDGFCQYRDVFVSSPGGETGGAVDARVLRRRYVTTFVKGVGIRIEHIHCYGEMCDLRRIIVWNYNQSFVWRCDKGWKTINGVQSVLSISRLVVPYLLLSSSNSALQLLGVVDVNPHYDDFVGDIECDVLDIGLIGGALARLWIDRHDSIVRKVKWNLPLIGSYGGSKDIAQVDLLSEISTEFEADRSLFVPIGSGPAV
jgi:hypothetical protein